MNEIQDGLNLVDSRVIALLASKRNLDIVKEMKYIEKAKTTRCFCKHWTQTDPCLYRSCRHRPEHHHGLSMGVKWEHKND